MKTRMHNGSRLLSLLLAVVLVFTLTVPALAADKPQDMNLRIAVMSDLHYLSPDMIADTADFEHALNSDRKLLKESSAILYEKFEQVRADKPDILLVSGDLTKDGEQECHAALAKQLQQLQQDIPGLKIYVINGNHDIRNYNAKNFNTPDGKAVPATRTHPEDFKRIYDFVYSDPTVIATFTPAAGNEAGSLSYVARPVEGLTIIAMDTCRYSKENTSNGTDEHETAPSAPIWKNGSSSRLPPPRHAATLSSVWSTTVWCRTSMSSPPSCPCTSSTAMSASRRSMPMPA